MRIPWSDVPARAPLYRDAETRSLYLTMRDGVKIAIDVTLPRPRTKTLPTIVRQTRYHRRFDYQRPFDSPTLRGLFDRQFAGRQYFVSRGYAWIDVCARGSGASGGRRPVPWSADEVEDGREIIDWIVAQPWSNGLVGARGVSYDGTSAEWMLSHEHPALRAVAPRFSLYDAFEDVAAPGGIHLEKFTRNWGEFNAALDRNDFEAVLRLILESSKEGAEQLIDSIYASDEDSIVSSALYLGPLTRLVVGRFVPGVAAVDDDVDRSILTQHLAERVPALDVHAAGKRVRFRDDPNLIDELPDATLDIFSPHAHFDRLTRSAAAVYHYSGWFDGAYPRATIRRFLRYDRPDHRLIIGPWEHGGQQNISPWEPSREPNFDHERELLRFFDAHLVPGSEAERAFASEPRVRYFTMGAERWRTADRWPPPGLRPLTLYLREHWRLDLEPAPRATEARLFVRGRHGTGKASRWQALLPTLAYTHYLPRQGDDILSFTIPLTRDLEVTGSPVVRIALTSSTNDPRIFAYLEDVEPSGATHYVTEGQLRAIHRRQLDPPQHRQADVPYRTFARAEGMDAPRGERLELEFDLLPTSYLFRRGHALRLVLAGADADQFEVGPAGAHLIHIEDSWLRLPMRDEPYSRWKAPSPI